MTQHRQQTESSELIGQRATVQHSPVGAIMLLLAVMTLGCQDLTGSQPLPAGTANPASYNTAAGALGQRNAALETFIELMPSYIQDAGLLSDEFVGVGGPGTYNPIDARSLPESSPTSAATYASDKDYNALNQVRGLANQAIGQLATYDPGASPALRGELYALEGYTEILLADLFCSGIPLSTLDYQHDYTYKPGAPTAQVYQDAVAKFDTALTLSSDSAQIGYLAAVGKGRALLDLGEYAEAAQAVATVPDQFQYQVPLEVVTKNGTATEANLLGQSVAVANQEGENGLPYIASGDPRSAATLETCLGCSSKHLVPNKYLNFLNSAGFAPLTIADGTEARLIQAEGALHSGDTTTWLQLLNHLRDSATVQATGQPEPQQLLPLAMPATDTSRISLMFAERAYWLFATGHRQGDLRRLIRQYNQTQAQVYPVGVYDAGGFYGTDVTAPIPGAEYVNPLFHGCIDRNA